MSFALTHLFIAWILGKAYEKWGKKTLSHTTWFFLLLGSVVPDGDFLLDWILGMGVHRTFSHSLLGILIAGVAVYLFMQMTKQSERKQAALAISVGILTHLIMDMTFSQGVPFLWPSLWYFSIKGIVYNPQTAAFLHGSTEVLQSQLKFAVVDMAIGTGWIFYLWWRKKIQF
jgi:membrane-bound metal-dependent hydrolase YbcI (DUF457 family)